MAVHSPVVWNYLFPCGPGIMAGARSRAVLGRLVGCAASVSTWRARVGRGSRVQKVAPAKKACVCSPVPREVPCQLAALPLLAACVPSLGD